MTVQESRIHRIEQETLSSLTQYTFPQLLVRQAERLTDEKIAIRRGMKLADWLHALGYKQIDMFPKGE